MSWVVDHEFTNLVAGVVEQHEKIFPNATLETQVAKLSEELLEMRLAKTRKDRDSEIGDVLYVACSLLRYEDTGGLFNFLVNTLYTTKKERVKAHLRKVLYMTGCKVEARNNKGAYKWTGINYERDKTI